jgi:type I restriction enzyme R subunit
VDVDRICNLVFLRRVNSRILFDQMLGRATRLCDHIGKETFRIFDAVRLYEALGNLTAMKPVVANASLSFEQLIAEMTQVRGKDQQKLVLEQLLAKLQRKKRHLDEQAERDFEICAGASPDAFIQRLKTMTLQEVAKWFTENPDLAEILDRKRAGQPVSVLVSHHPDEFRSAEHGYGKAKKPKDFLEEFSAFLRNSGNSIPALTAVLTRPRELTRKQLRELKLALDNAGFPETALATAWRDMTNQDIAASIIGYIRRSALGDPLIPFDQRVDHALTKLLAEQKWTKPQRDWLQVIANQTKANLLVDRDALNDENLIFRTEGGGFARLNKVFDGKLEQLLDHFNDTVWPPAAEPKDIARS